MIRVSEDIVKIKDQTRIFKKRVPNKVNPIPKTSSLVSKKIRQNFFYKGEIVEVYV